MLIRPEYAGDASSDALVDNMRLVFLIPVLVLLTGCLTQPARPKVKVMTLDEAASRLSQLSGKTIRPYATRDFGRDQNAAARSVVVANGDARKIVESLRQELGDGLLAFIGCTRSLAKGAGAGSEVVVATGNDQFEILRIAQSDAINYDMETEDLVRKLQEYDSQYGIDIFHAETDTIEFTLKSLPKDLSAFCDDLYEFCPDIVDQGVDTVEKLQAAVAKNQTVYLWWD